MGLLDLSETVRGGGAIAIRDYGCAGPYREIDMREATDAQKEAIVLSTHKFPGGPGRRA